MCLCAAVTASRAQRGVMLTCCAGNYSKVFCISVWPSWLTITYLCISYTCHKRSDHQCAQLLVLHPYTCFRNCMFCTLFCKLSVDGTATYSVYVNKISDTFRTSKSNVFCLKNKLKATMPWQRVQPKVDEQRSVSCMHQA